MSYVEWESRWEEKRIGFHLDEVNPYLVKHEKIILEEQPESVFIPLCGKSQDMVWLAEKTRKVVGIELIDKACKDFYMENQLDHSWYDAGKLKLYSSESIDIFQGDFFDMGLGHSRPFNAIYDRASLIALPAEMREKYVKQLMKFLVIGGKLLLITLSYDQSKMSGPPYAVKDDEVQSLFSEYGELTCLETQDVLNDRFKSKGLDWMQESVYHFVRS